VPPAAPPDKSQAPPTPPAQKRSSQNPGQFSQEYARNLQQSITSQVNSQVGKINAAVADQLRQTARGLSPDSGVAGATGQHARPCAEITNACKAAGFLKGGKDGNGIGNDCIVPIVDGTPQPADAAISLPKISPDTIARCKAINPNYGHFKKEQSTPPDSSSDSGPH
jgi:hypothetical protein